MTAKPVEMTPGGVALGNRSRQPPGTAVLGGLLLVVAAFPVVAALITGALAVPFQDDWAYLRIAQEHAQSGRLDLINWNDASLVGVLPFTDVAGAVAGNSITTMRVVTLGFYAFLLIGIWLLCKRVLPRPYDLFAALTVVAFPSLAISVPTLMVDVPALTCQVWCLYLALRGLEGRAPSPGWLSLSLLVGLLGLTIRQQAALAPLAVLVVWFVLASPGRPRAYVLAAGGVFMAAAGGFVLWRGSLPNAGRNLGPLVNASGALATVVLFTAGFLLPVLLLHARALGVRRRALLLSLAASTILTVAMVKMADDLFRGYGVSRTGALGNHLLLPGSRPDLLPAVLWLVLLLALALGGGLLLVVIVHHLRSLGRAAGWRLPRAVRLAVTGPAYLLLLRVYLLLTVLFLLLAAYFTGAMFDRYLLGAVVLAVPALLVPAATRWTMVPWWATGITAGLALVVLVNVWDAQTFAVARWQAGQWGVQHGVPADAIDAGFEWVGYHYTGEIQPYVTLQPAPDGLPQAWYLAHFPGFQRQLVVLAKPLPGVPPVATVQYSEWFGLAERQVYVYAKGPGTDVGGARSGPDAAGGQ